MGEGIFPNHSETVEVTRSGDFADARRISLGSGGHCVRIVHRDQRDRHSEAAFAGGLEALLILTERFHWIWTVAAEVVDGVSDDFPGDGFVEVAGAWALVAVAVFLNSTAAGLLALVRAAREARLSVAGHARAVGQADGLVLAAAHTAIVAEVVAEPARAFAGANVTRSRPLSTV
eukprot:CAMPEP_0197522742 /NCGR_PEP_ID=MMETSP1318-20131121/7826_1 /TAXON_ID=552666 /ORGANISM="Partenskyella glossopodia, Strain RCC365" /LENGTH=174 /DNA_ID=CAMNT_0043075207 /DNA_START=583 /DNA_END=1104 /DNA_ORIENTATION=+